MPDHAADGNSLVRAADGALYLAKDRGRSRVEVAAAAGSPSNGAGLPEMVSRDGERPRGGVSRGRRASSEGSRSG